MADDTLKSGVDLKEVDTQNQDHGAFSEQVGDLVRDYSDDMYIYTHQYVAFNSTV